MSRTILLESYLLELINSRPNSSSPWIQIQPICSQLWVLLIIVLISFCICFVWWPIIHYYKMAVTTMPVSAFRSTVHLTAYVLTLFRLFPHVHSYDERTTPSVTIVDCFDKSKCINFIIYLDIIFI